MSDLRSLAIACGVLLGLGGAASAQTFRTPGPDSRITFVNVAVVPMDSDRVIPGQTVVVEDGRIAAVGNASDISVPVGGPVIDGAGRYLAPGLTDAHVHLEGDGTGLGGSRSDFGDGAIYLAYGVTTVFNLRGTPAHLDWRRRIESGELVGPTIYTAGEFVNEPRVQSAEDVERDIAAQASAGYDLIKFHEIMNPAQGFTTRGLTPQAYQTMIDAARAANLTLIGHAPVNLGLEAALEAGQPLAHIGTLSNIYFLPLASNRGWLLTTTAALVSLTVAILAGVVRSFVGRKAAARRVQAKGRSIRFLLLVTIAAWVPAALCAALFLPGGPMFESDALRSLFTALLALAATSGLWLAVIAIRSWGDPHLPAVLQWQATIGALAGLTLAWAAVAFWVPVAWRSSDAGITGLAIRLRKANVPVQTTIVNYDAIGGPGRERLVRDPVMNYLTPDVRARWGRAPRAAPPGYRYTTFVQKVAGALHRAGVPLMAGTDAMGYPLIAPGASLHHELRLLVESGLTPYEALRAATTVPAAFIGRDREFGRIAVGQRADLVLIDRNPIEDISALTEPAGVMTRGRWFPREDLLHRLAALAP
jgi:hypothetical protein